MELEDLIGKTVHQVLADPDRYVWRFVTDQGNMDYYCFADCCSESWVNHVESIDALIGHKVLGVEEFDMFGMLGVEPEPTKQEVDQVMFHRITTDKGVCVIEFRNSSNGYYGGSFCKGWDGAWDDSVAPVTEDF